MAQIAFDTLEYSNRLQAGGIPREHAEAIAKANALAIRDMLTTQELVTKKDLALGLAETRGAMEARIAETSSNLEAKLADTKHELLKWIIGLAAAQVSLMAAIAGVVIAILK